MKKGKWSSALLELKLDKAKKNGRIMDVRYACNPYSYCCDFPPTRSGRVSHTSKISRGIFYGMD